MATASIYYSYLSLIKGLIEVISQAGYIYFVII